MYSTSIPNGGLGFSPYLIGVTRGIYGLANSFVLLFLAGPLVRRFGARTTYIFAFANISVCISAYPLLSFFAQRVGRVDAIVWAIIVVQLLSNLAMSMAYGALPPPSVSLNHEQGLKCAVAKYSFDPHIHREQLPPAIGTLVHELHRADGVDHHALVCALHRFGALCALVGAEPCGRIFCVHSPPRNCRCGNFLVLPPTQRS